MTIEEHLAELEKKQFDKTRIFELYENCVEDRKEWDSMAYIGAMIYSGKYMSGSKLDGDTSDQNEFYNINFVRDNLKHVISKTLVNEIDAVLVSDRNDIDKRRDILEIQLNYIIDRERIIRDLKQVLTQNKFMGFGVGHVSWDHDNTDADWWTGKPKHTPIDPRSFWYIAKQNLETKKDIEMVFHKERYTINEFKIKYPKFYKEYQNGIESMTDEQRLSLYNYRMGIISVVICQYKKRVITKQRAIANEEPEGMHMRYFSEDEYMEYLREIGASEKELLTASKLGEDLNDTKVFPEFVRASEVLERTEMPWYQVVFIPETQQILEGPEYIGKYSNYVIMPGEWNPDSIYSIPEAYQYKELQKMAGILLTTMVLNTVKIQKPIPIVVTGALKNEAHFLQNYNKIGVVARVDSNWAKNNPGVNPVRWLEPPQSGNMQALLFQLVEKAMDKSMSTPNVSRGVPDYSGQSGKQTALLQQMSNIDIQPDFFAVEEYLRKVCDRIKDMIADKRDYPHQIFLPRNTRIDGLTTDDGQRSIINVNTDSDNKIADIADRCYTRVTVEKNIDQTNVMRDAKYENLFTAGLIDFEEYITHQTWADNPEELLEAYERSGNDRAIAEFINQNPQIKESVMQLMQNNPEMEATTQGANTETPIQEA